MKKSILGLGVAALMLVAAATPAYAQTTEDVIANLKQQIASLLQQVSQLQATVGTVQDTNAALRTEVQELRAELTANLRIGSRSEQVRLLQEALSEDSDVYPEGIISGYFGPLTEKAVKRFQAKYGIDQVGNVGPLTRAKFNELFAKRKEAWENYKNATSTHDGRKYDDDDDEDDDDHKDRDRNRDKDKDRDRDHTTWIKDHKMTLCHNDTNTIEVAIASAFAHFAHGDKLGACSGDGMNDDDDDDNATTTPDTTVPVISNVSATSTATSTVAVSWNTNEAATSKAWFSTSTPVVLNTAMMQSNGSLVTNHSLTLSSLTASTTYYYLVTSSDAAGNTATSTQYSFFVTE